MFKIPKILFTSFRQMTYQEGLSYLKPFIFEIHPDFFEQIPTAKETNQNSLKLLYNYLQSLDNNRDKNISLQFYIREKLNERKLSTIKINLQERSINNAVYEILTFCKDLINIDKIPLKKDKRELPTLTLSIDFYESNFYRAPKSVKINIIDWIEKTIFDEIKTREIYLITMKNIDEIKVRILDNHNVSDIVWLSNYDDTKQFACLISLSRILDELRSGFDPIKIIFTSDEQSGISCYGDLLLSCKQVEQIWRKEFLNLRKNIALSFDIDRLEADISGTLQNSEIVLIKEMHQCCLAKDYKKNLEKLQFTLSLFRVDKFRRINSGYKYAITDLTSNPFIHHSGAIVIPAHIESRSILSYLDNNLTQQIQSTKLDYTKHINTFNRLKAVFISDFKCKNVILNVPLNDGTDCLKKLLNLLRLHYKILNFDYSNIIIDNYYGTTSTGDIIIPWNF